MKILTIISLLLLSLSARSQWVEQNSGTNEPLWDVFFVDENNGHISGANIILRTTDGGTNWIKTDFPSGTYIDGIFFTSITTGFACAYSIFDDTLIVYKTTDGGVSWSTTYLNSSSYPREIFFVNSLTGFIVSYEGVVFKTSNGGISWSKSILASSGMMESVFFIDQNHGFIASGGIDYAVLLETTNGGNTWTEISTPATNFLKSVFFPSANIGYCVGWDGIVIKTTDGGATWISQTAVPTYGNLDVYFINDSIGYIVGGQTNVPGILKTTNGGNLWYEQSSTLGVGLTSVCFPGSETGYCVGSEGKILKTSNGGETGIQKNTPNLEFNVFPNPASDFIHIKCDQKVNVRIIDQGGRIIQEYDNNSDEYTIDLNSLDPDVYFIEAWNEDAHSFKIITKL